MPGGRTRTSPPMTSRNSVGGFLLLDKPSGTTSHGMVARARRSLSVRRIGHAGTLDPMATGLLVLGVGTATRLLTFLVGQPKRYEATVRLGWATVTDDAEGDPIAGPTGGRGADQLNDPEIFAGFASMTGTILQRPSAVSAVKVGGRRSYERVRAGEDVELSPREVRISELRVTGIRRKTDHLDVTIDCSVSSGTYIRAIARDVGEALGVGGHLTALRRTRVGPFSVDEARRGEDLLGTSAADLTPAAEVMTRVLPVIEVSGDRVLDVRNGRPWWFEDTPEAPTDRTGDSQGTPHAVVDAEDGELLAVVRPEDGRWRYAVVLPG